MKYYSPPSAQLARLMKLICCACLCMAAWVSFGADMPPIPGSKPVKVLLSPKAAQTIQSMGAKMVALVVVPPPVLTNITVNAYWYPVSNATYHVFLGTNEANNNSWTWSAVTTTNKTSWTVRVQEDARFFAQVWIITGNKRTPTEIASDQPFPANAVAVWWNPPIKDVVVQVSQNLKSWVNTFQGQGPLTNMIQFDKNQFYRAVTAAPPVAMTIEPLRLWNPAAGHFGR